MKILDNSSKIFVVLFFILPSSLLSQVTNIPENRTEISLRDFLTYQDQNMQYPNDAYFKDIHGDLDKYTGEWKGFHDNRTYMLKVEKKIDEYEGMYMDILIMRYKITSSSGTVILNTYNSNLSHYLIVDGYFLDVNSDNENYCYNYNGENSGCGSDSGWFYMKVNPTSLSQMTFIYVPWGEVSAGCEEVSTVETFPLNMNLIKQ